MPHALFVFAHQDDEIATATRIAHLLRSGWTVSCAFLTNGKGIRDEESRVVLARLGVDLARVHFLGSEEGIEDGTLVAHLDRALQLIDARITEAVDEVYTLAYEGGHHDHDAAHLVAAAFALRRGAACLEMPLYHGYKRPFLYSVLAPIRLGGTWTSRRVPRSVALRTLSLARFYRSQRKTWIGLLPEALLRTLLGAKEWTRRVDIARLGARPHDGPLFYERRFRVTWQEFEAKSREFAARLAQPPPPPPPRESDRR